VFPRDRVCLRNISVDTLHKGDTMDNNNNNYYYYCYYIYLYTDAVTNTGGTQKLRTTNNKYNQYQLTSPKPKVPYS
jgi:hypothetical protein